MNEVAGNLADAQQLGERILFQIDQAMLTADVAESQMHLREAMTFGEELEMLLAESAFEVEEHVVTDEIEHGLVHLREFFRLGVDALSKSSVFLQDEIRKMKPLVIEALDHISEAAATLGY